MNLPPPSLSWRAEKLSAESCTLELRLKTIDQLFNSLDAAPFIGRTMDREAVRFITEWATTQPSDAKLELSVHLQTPPPPDKEAELEESIRHHFSTSLDICRRQMRVFYRRARLNLLIGVVFCAACMALAQYTSDSGSRVGNIISSGLVIVAWVALWRPTEMFMYDRLPMVTKRGVLARLADMRVVCDSGPLHSSSGTQHK